MLIKILVVDDSASDRMIIQNMLSEFCVLTACDGVEALRALEEQEGINLIILDLNMPNMDGFQVLESLNQKEGFQKLRTIILTNYGELDNEIKGLKLGAVDYIRKPIHMDSLKARIDVHVALLRAQQALEQELHDQGITFEMIFNQVPVGIAVSYNKEAISAGLNRFFSVNPAFEKITGRTKEELMRLGWASITHPDDLEEDLRYYQRLQAGEIEGYAMDKRFIRPDGSIVWVHMLGSKLILDDNHSFNHIALFKDIMESILLEKKLTESERSKSTLLSHLPGMAYRCSHNREWTMQYVSSGCLALTGYAPENLIDSKDLSFGELIAPKYRELLWQEWDRVLESRRDFSLEYEISTAAGENKWVLQLGQGVYDGNGEVKALEGIIIDITDRKAAENTLKYNNEHDGWTGLLNRSFFEGFMNNELKKHDNAKRALISINLRGLQKLTVAYGFHYMQSIIKKVAQALDLLCTGSRLLFNTYENRFVYYIDDYADQSDLYAFCDEIIQSLESILSIERVGGGIGVYELEQNTPLNADEILKNLLIASEKAAEEKDSDFKVRFYDALIAERLIREQEIEKELYRVATDANGGGLYLHYQPILDTKTHNICGFEALARLASPSLGEVSPVEFIPIAEKTKLIIPIGDKILRTALQFLNRLRGNGYRDTSVSINISVIQLLGQGFCDNLLRMIQELRVSTEHVGLEITESVFSSNYSEINDILFTLKEAGLHISIDDFGTGYSSLARESELNVNCLKIDKHFIDSMAENPEKSIVADIISMAHKFGHCTVAEGVERQEQMDYLKAYGCDRIQGYLISKPLDEQAALEFLKKQGNMQ